MMQWPDLLSGKNLCLHNVHQVNITDCPSAQRVQQRDTREKSLFSTDNSI